MPSFKTSDYLGMLRELAPEWARARAGETLQTLPTVQHAIWIDVQGAGANEPGFRRFSGPMQTGDPQDPRIAQAERQLRNTDPINIQFTSGTTGFPKGATLTHRNILNNGFSSARR